ncbi:hypothetical protein GCM10010095_62370 [Streptomyces anthocyanicus]|uniref:hypothetical protein n=1 Tax=Streptomyces anthocyanicus TaxID=68174 RepID=UPI001670405D|nr:hypothetical protein [Streptomyces anthocyanicus]GGL69069.1 hypothetical protein GCM10010095_62370 [Streptomyces anthocyanicus]
MPFAAMDDPRHAEHRRMLTRFFTVKRVGSMRQDIEDVVHDSLDRMVAHGRPADLVGEFTLPVPSEVIARLLDVPQETTPSSRTTPRRCSTSPPPPRRPAPPSDLPHNPPADQTHQKTIRLTVG